MLHGLARKDASRRFCDSGYFNVEMFAHWHEFENMAMVMASPLRCTDVRMVNRDGSLVLPHTSLLISIDYR